MKLQSHTPDEQNIPAARRDIDVLIENCRPAPAPCLAACPKTGERKCSPDCPDAAIALTSEPETAPLEAAIAPLVYQLKKLGVFEPFWSCEGHDGTDGQLWKTPRVWFYADSVIHVRVLAECIAELSARHHLNHPWQVTVTYCEPQNAGAAFALQPCATETLSLASLRRDIRTITEALPYLAEELARAIRATLAAS